MNKVRINNKSLLKSIVFLCFILTYNVSVQAQNVPPVDDPDNQENQNIEMLSEQNGIEDADYSNLIETWAFYREHPIDLNHTTREQLNDLGILTEIQISALFRHIRLNGKLFSVYELQGIAGYDPGTIRKLLPYVKVSSEITEKHLSLKTIFKEGRHDVTYRLQRILEKQSGYQLPDDSAYFKSSSKYYVGDPYRNYLRYRFQYSNNVSWGLIAEKDAGETFRAIDSLKKPAGFDFYTGHFYLKNIGKIKALAIGDYQAGFGQGLVMLRGFAMGKTSMITSIKRNTKGITPYSSVDENRFLRGAATTIKLGPLELSGFFSYKKIDANIIFRDTSNATFSDPEEMSSIIQTGSHTTISEIRDRNKSTEMITGGNISYNRRNFHIGATAQMQQFDKALNKTNYYYNQFDFNGKQNANAGMDFSWTHQNFNLFGELAVSKSGGKAGVAGIIAAIDPRVNLAIQYRHFDRNYQNLLGLAVSENTLPQNEKGLFMGIDAKLNKGFSISTYMDLFVFPWLKYQTPAPSYGHDYFGQINWTPNKKTDMYLRYRNRNKQESTDEMTIYDQNANRIQENIRYNVSFQIIPYLKIRSRVEYLQLKKSGNKTEHGILVMQDLVYKKIGSPIEITARYAMFETDSYDSRIYTYENDVLYSFSIPAFYYKGSRAYLLLDWNITRNLELWARVAQTFYTNVTVQSAGSPSEIKGPSKTELKLQIRYRF